MRFLLRLKRISLLSLSTVITGLCLFTLNVSAADSLAFAQRIDTFSASFLGTKYIASPLGEEIPIDTDPLLRFDAFDCTTYVETVGAMAISQSTEREDILKILNQIRYAKNTQHFLERNHFTSADWIPNNIQKGLYQDLTPVLFSNNYKVHYTEIDKAAWLFKNFNKTSSLLSGPISVPLNIIAIDDLVNVPTLLNYIPHGAVINLALINDPTIKNKIGTDLDIRHQAFAIWKNGSLYLRHARSPQYGVTENLMLPFLKQVNALPVKKFNAINIGYFLQK